jgi:16S rRNA (guanine527-N7)-methyltransferase
MNGVDLLLHYFPKLTAEQISQYTQLGPLFKDWNDKINLVSRKDIENLYEKHVLHSLGIAKVINFKTGSKVIDVGTGGGFPGIPLAIFFPEVKFTLVDSIGKKIMVVKDIVEKLNLENVTAFHDRVENIPGKFDFVTARAVTEMSAFYGWVKNKIGPKQINSLPNGILYLKGGDLKDEVKPFRNRAEIIPLSNYFKEEYFETKAVVYIEAAG